MIFSDEQDVLKGREVLGYFHNESVGAPGYKAKNIDELARLINPKKPNEVFRGIGFMSQMLMSTGVYNSGDLRRAMIELADQANGKIPTAKTFDLKIQSITQNMPGVFATFQAVSAQTVKDVASGAQAVGDAVISTGKSMTNLMPLVLTVGAIAYVFLFVKNRS